MAVRLLPEPVSEQGEGGGGGVDHKETPETRFPADMINGGETRDSASGDESVNHKGCLPAFRFEREGLAFDEYHTHGDVPYEVELAKRVKAAISLAHPEDACESRSLPFKVACMPSVTIPSTLVCSHMLIWLEGESLLVFSLVREVLPRRWCSDNLSPPSPRITS